MAKRLSRNRRLSAARRLSNNLSGFLNDDTNVEDGNDPLWYNRTSVRPSTSFVQTRNASSVLSPDTTVEASQLSEKWYNNLSKSDSSKLMEAAVQNKIANQSNREQDHSLMTESESDQEPQKRRAKLGLNKKRMDNSVEKSNIFLKALEKTTDSHQTRNFTRALLEGNESESTNDDSRTVQRLRPRMFRNAKQADNETNRFDNVFAGDSATEKLLEVPSIRVSLNPINEEQISTSEMAANFGAKRKSILKKRQNDDVTLTPETAQKQQRKSGKAVRNDISMNEQSIENIHANKSLVDDIIPSTPKSTRNSRKLSLNKSGDASKQRAMDEFVSVSHNSTADKSRKKSALFSQDRKSKSNVGNMFDGVFDSDEEKTGTEASSKKHLESTERNDEEDNDDHESSSIPKHIRRTRSLSVFARNPSDDENDAESSDHEKDQAQHKSQSQNKSTASQKDKSSSDAAEKITELDEDGSSSFEIYAVTKSQQRTIEETDEEDIYENAISKNKKSKLDESANDSQNQSSQRKSSQAPNASEQRKTVNSTRSSRSASNNITDRSNASKSNKSRSKLFNNRKSQAESENAFDQISYESSIELRQSGGSNATQDNNNSSKASQRRSNISGNLSKSNEAASRADDQNESQQDEIDADTSSMPKHIRRTMSRVFQKTKTNDDSSTAQEASSRNKSHRTPNKSLNSSRSSQKNNTSVLREANDRGFSKLFKTPQVPSHNVSIKSISNESQKQNQTSTDQRTHNKSNTSLSKKNTTPETPDKNPANPIDRTPEASQAALKSRSRAAAVPQTPVDDPASDVNSDDLLSTPHPAQSTLNPHGKRITQFSFRHSIVPESPAAASSPMKEAVVENRNKQGQEEEEEEEKEEEEKEAAAAVSEIDVELSNEDVDVENNSVVSDCPLLSRRAEEIPAESEDEAANPKARVPDEAKATSTSASGPCASSIDEATWSIFRKRTDAVKSDMEARARRAEQAERERAERQARLDAQFRRRLAQQATEKRRLQRKPLDKAYLVNGVPYKQPKLPRPKKWVTKRLYDHLRKCIEPEHGIETRIRSEEFVLKLTDVYNVVVKRKKYDNYKHELDDLMRAMAKLNIIENRYDFWRFCSEYMPPDFKDKVVPMQLPGNVRNIPYDPELVYVPILKKKNRKKQRDRDERKNSSQSDND